MLLVAYIAKKYRKLGGIIISQLNIAEPAKHKRKLIYMRDIMVD